MDNTSTALALAARIVRSTGREHTSPPTQPTFGASLRNLEHRWHRHHVRPTCSRSGNTSALARLIDPIDIIDYGHDQVQLTATQRSLEHQAKILALVAIGWTPEP